MAMLISKFHRLIQSKLLWASFLVIVVFTFVVWGTSIPKASKDASEASSPGTLNDKPVSIKEFQNAYWNSYLSVILSMGRAFNITPDIDKQLRDVAWRRIVSLNQAKEMGLGATDDEVAQAIQSDKIFLTEDGRFNKAQYKYFVENFLSTIRFTERQFEEHVREELVMQKLRVIASKAVMVSPFELNRTFHSISDKFVIQYAVMGSGLVSNEVKVTDADVSAFFEKNKESFTIPEMAKVKYVRFATAPFRDMTHVTPESVQEYYDSNLSEFMRFTNAAEEAAASAADTNDLMATRYIPLEEASPVISNILVKQMSLDLATDKALEFVTALTPDRDGVSRSFEDVAKEFNVLVESAEPFTAQSKVPGVDAGQDFNEAAFNLNPGADSYFSDPVRGNAFVYVLALENKIPPRVPELAEVKNDVKQYAQQQAISDALGNKAKELRDAAEAAVKAGQPFASVFTHPAVTVVTTEPFTASTGPTTNDYSELLMRGILTRNKGEISDLLPTYDAVLVAYVQDRTAGDPMTFDSLKQQIENSIRRQNTRLLFEGWQDHLLKEANFTPRALPVDEEEAEAADETAESSAVEAEGDSSGL